MRHFVAGFVVASVLWAGVFYLNSTGALDEYLPADEESSEAVAQAQESVKTKGKRKKRKRRKKRRTADGRDVDRRQVSTGDDLDWGGAQAVDMNAGEERLTGAEIDAGFDSVFGRIRRCLLLVPGNADVSGKLIFGMRVAGNGRPKAVNLSGPAYVTRGESGTCLRKAARGIRFATFDGPDMVFKYPVDLE